MNKPQKITWLLRSVGFLVSALFPPWANLQVRAPSLPRVISSEFAGWHFVLSPPDNNWYAVAAVTSIVALGLFRTRAWGWWCGMLLHWFLLASGTIAYAVTMWIPVNEFGRPRGHMELLTLQGAAVILTMIFAVAAAVAVVPVLVLRTQCCRKAFGVSFRKSAEEQPASDTLSIPEKA